MEQVGISGASKNGRAQRGLRRPPAHLGASGPDRRQHGNGMIARQAPPTNVRPSLPVVSLKAATHKHTHTHTHTPLSVSTEQVEVGDKWSPTRGGQCALVLGGPSVQQDAKTLGAPPAFLLGRLLSWWPKQWAGQLTFCLLCSEGATHIRRPASQPASQHSSAQAACLYKPPPQASGNTQTNLAATNHSATPRSSPTTGVGPFVRPIRRSSGPTVSA